MWLQERCQAKSLLYISMECNDIHDIIIIMIFIIMDNGNPHQNSGRETKFFVGVAYSVHVGEFP